MAADHKVAMCLTKVTPQKEESWDMKTNWVASKAWGKDIASVV